MSVSKKVLRKMKKVMGLIGAIPVLAACSSQVSCARRRDIRRNAGVTYIHQGTILYIKGSGKIERSHIKECLTEGEMENISEIYIDSGITVIGEFAFANFIELKSINIPNSVTEIGKFAFFYCKSLEGITIPSSVTSIGVWAFSRCISLKEITIPNSVASIDDKAFYNCKTLESIVFENCGRGKDIVALNAFNLRFGELVSKGLLRKDHYGNLESNESGTLSSLLKEFLCVWKTVTIGNNALSNCKMLRLIDTNGLLLNLARNALNGTLFQNLGGKIICGKYHYWYNHEMMGHMFLLESINDRFNKDGDRINPADRPLRYPFSNPGVRNIAQ